MVSTQKPDTHTRDRETEEDLAEILASLGDVSLRLARKLKLDPEGQDDSGEEGGNADGNEEGGNADGNNE